MAAVRWTRSILWLAFAVVLVLGGIYKLIADDRRRAPAAG